MVSPVRMEAENRLRKSLMKRFQVPEEVANGWASLVSYPTEKKFAHVAFPCHSLARHLKMAPQAIAELMTEDFRMPKKGDLLHEPRSVGGYLNLSVDVSALFQRLELTGPADLTPEEVPDDAARVTDKVDVEFSQPNTHKALHVGHLRNMIYGDAVCNLLEATGIRIVRSTFPGDLGTHVAKCLWFIQKLRRSQIPPFPDPVWLGNMYRQSDAYLKNIEGEEDEFVARQEIAEVLRQLESRCGEHYELYLLTREWSLSHFKEIYRWLGIRFDQWHFESECDEESRELALQTYQEGIFQKSQGAIGMDLSEYGLGFALFLKSDGSGLYITKDLALLKRKFADPAVKASIVVVDARQKLHFKQLFKTAELMGYTQAKRSVHLAYEAVTDEQGEAFSSRGHTGPSLEDLRELLVEKVSATYLNVYRDQWDPREIREAAEKIALAALKYGFLKYDSSKIIRFVLDDWIQMEGNTGPYLLYTYARCQSLLAKIPPEPGTRRWFPTDMEKDLILYLEQFPSAIQESAREYRPSVLCTYLFELCRSFNRFYKECPIKSAEDPSLRTSRRALTDLVAASLRQGFALLGMPSLERM